MIVTPISIAVKGYDKAKLAHEKLSKAAEEFRAALADIECSEVIENVPAEVEEEQE